MIHTTSAAEPHFFTATSMSGNNGYITWIEPSAGNDVIKFSKGENVTILAKAIRISDKGGNSGNPIAASGNNVYMLLGSIILSKAETTSSLAKVKMGVSLLNQSA